jgi:anti-sigma factor RsiW
MDKHVDVEAIAEYFDALTSVEQRRRIEVHLAECDACADLATTLFASSALLDQWTAKQVKAAKDLKSAVETARSATLIERVREAVGW